MLFSPAFPTTSLRYASLRRHVFLPRQNTAREHMKGVERMPAVGEATSRTR